jgi:hypothetical protein
MYMLTPLILLGTAMCDVTSHPSCCAACAAVPFRFSGMYSHLSGYVHGLKLFQISATAIDIVEGAVSGEQMQVLACIAKAVGVDYNMIFEGKAILAINSTE